MTSPSQPVNIRSPKRSPGNNDLPSQPGSYATPSFVAAAGGGLVGTPSFGTPDLRALRAGYTGTPPPPNIPPRNPAAGTPTNGNTKPTTSSSSPFAPAPPTSAKSPEGQVVGALSATRQPPLLSSESPAPTPPINIADLDDLPAEEKAKVLGRHLVPKQLRSKASGTPLGTGGESTPSPSGEATPASGGGGGAPLRPTSTKSAAASIRSRGSEIGLGAGGGDETRSRRSSNNGFGGPHAQREDSEPFPIPYHAPGADVTHDIYKWHSDQRKQAAARVRSASFAGPSTAPHPAFEHIHEPGGFRRNYVKQRAEEQGVEEPEMLNNFIDFLFLFGHFAGEDLEENEDEDKLEDEETLTAEEAAALEAEPTETTSLLGSQTLGRARSFSRTRRSRRRGGSVSHQGTATVTQAVLMLLKSFIGTGVLFLGKAFFNGGLLFSALTFTFIALLSLYSFLLLVKTKFIVSGSFGDIGGALYGPWMRYLILGSIVVSQLGFVAAYTIFVAENLQAFVLGVTNCAKLIPVQYFIVSELVVFLPLVLVRDLAKLSGTALVADGFILLGLLYIFGSEFSIIASRGIADVKLFNSKDFPLFVGTAVFSFEGIGLVIPITDAMREPHKFPKALSGVMAFLLLLFGGAGILAYLTFGSSIQTVVLVNLDSRSKMVQSVQFLYALAILLSVPLQLFPAIRILENGIFTRSGKGDARVKWTKNTFRWGMVLVTTVVSTLGAADLDKFVAFVGCFACVPLCYVYPAMLHYKACARTRKDKVYDILMIIFGLLAAAYTSFMTLKLMLEPASPGDVPAGNCDGGRN